MGAIGVERDPAAGAFGEEERRRAGGLADGASASSSTAAGDSGAEASATTAASARGEVSGMKGDFVPGSRDIDTRVDAAR